MNNIEQNTEIYDLWIYIREWNDKFGRLPKDEDELAACIDYVMKRQKPAEWSEKYIADVFEKVGLAKIVREQSNDALTEAVQSAMIELSKFTPQLKQYKQKSTDAIAEIKQVEGSKENEKHIDNIISLLNQAKERFIRESGQFPSWITEILWLKSLKDRVQPQLKQDWSEEDERRFKYCKRLVYASDKYSIEDRKETVDWLKSIKPQTHWKPSEEQMEALNAINTIGEISYIGQGNLLIELYNELKKL